MTEESLARDLETRLAALPGIDVSAQGRGFHWNCIARKGNRACTIHCFATTGQQYLESFESESQRQAWGRASKVEDIVSASQMWLDARPLSDLHGAFDFVDRQRRALRSIQDRCMADYPRLRDEAHFELQGLDQRGWGTDQHELWIRAADRSCKVYFHGADGFSCEFHWDDCVLFKIIQQEYSVLSAMLHAWLCALTAPTEMAARFGNFTVSRVALAYEQGRGLEGEFEASWDEIEAHFGRAPDAAHRQKILAMLQAMRQDGFDSQLRAGQSMLTLILSRARRHGLRGHESSITFEFMEPEWMRVTSHIHGETDILREPIAFGPQIQELLRRLAALPVE